MIRGIPKTASSGICSGLPPSNRRAAVLRRLVLPIELRIMERAARVELARTRRAERTLLDGWRR